MTDSYSNDPLQDKNAREEFVLLFTRERRRIYAFVYSMVPIEADAEDIFQQASAVLWRRFTEFDSNRDFYNWACGIVFYTVQNYRRTKRRGRVFFSNELVSKLAEDRIKWSAGESERAEALEECVTLLRAEDRHLITQVFGVGMTTKEAAKELGRTVHSVYKRMRFIRMRLMDCIDGKLNSRRELEG